MHLCSGVLSDQPLHPCPAISLRLPSLPFLCSPPHKQVLSFAGELLANAESLLRDGLHPTEIADGYAKAGAKALEVLDTLVLPGTGAHCMRARAAAERARADPAALLARLCWQHAGPSTAARPNPWSSCRHPGRPG